MGGRDARDPQKARDEQHHAVGVVSPRVSVSSEDISHVSALSRAGTGDV
jgi:hypothetical protein